MIGWESRLLPSDYTSPECELCRFWGLSGRRHFVARERGWHLILAEKGEAAAGAIFPVDLPAAAFPPPGSRALGARALVKMAPGREERGAGPAASRSSRGALAGGEPDRAKAAPSPPARFRLFSECEPPGPGAGPASGDERKIQATDVTTGPDSKANVFPLDCTALPLKCFLLNFWHSRFLKSIFNY